MHTDTYVQFSSGEQDLSENIGNHKFADSFDLGRAKKTSPSKSPGPLPFLARPEMYIRVTVTETLAPSTSTIKLQAIFNSTSGLVDSGLVVKDLTAALTAAQFAKGQVFTLPLPKSNDLKRWMGMRFVIAATNATGGKCIAEIVPSVPEDVGLSAPQSPRRQG